MSGNVHERDVRHLRVAQVVATDAFAGAERYATSLAIGLSRLGADAALVGGSAPGVRTAIVDAGAHLAHFPAAGLSSAWSQLRKLGPLDIVHAHLTTAEVAATLAFPTRSRAAVVSTRHIAARRGSSLAGRMAAPFVRARLDGQLAPSTHVAERVDGTCIVIPTGVEDSELGAHDEPIVMVVQRLEFEKDTETALLAWAASGLASRGWELHVTGTGSQEAALRDLARQLEIQGSCRFLGHVNDVPRRLARASVMLATAPAEAFGLAVAEAMACGLPVVAAAAGGHLETLGQMEGAALFEPGDHKAAAALLRRFAEDASARATYGARLLARQRSEYSLDGFVNRVATWYLDVLSGRGYSSLAGRAASSEARVEA